VSRFGEADRVVRRFQLAGLRHDREAWEEAARTCVCAPGLCSRRDFRDHGETDSPVSMVCAELDPGQPCYGAVLRTLLRASAGR
jgi:hypothetical protein